MFRYHSTGQIAARRSRKTEQMFAWQPRTHGKERGDEGAMPGQTDELTPQQDARQRLHAAE